MRTAPRAAAPVLLCTLLAACLHAFAPAAAGAVEVTVARDVSVPAAGHAQVTVDVWHGRGARAARRRPVALLVHGGGWHTGDKRQWEASRWAQRLAARGWLVVNANYRLACGRRLPVGTRVAPEAATARATQRVDRDPRLCGHAMRTSLHDVRAALRFAAANARRWGGDPDRIVLFGASAGAQLALVVGSDRRRPGGVRAVVAISPPADLAWIGQRPELPIHPSAARSFGCALDACAGAWLAASPMAQVRRGVSPPTWIFTAASDRITPLGPARAYANRLRSARVPVTVVTTADAAEGCHGPQPCAQVRLAGSELRIFEHAQAWLGRHVR